MPLKDSQAFTSLAASDINRAKTFYTKTLGLEYVAELAENTILLRTSAGSQILIYEREQSKAEHTVVGFMVQDFETSMTSLNSAGVNFEVYEGLTDENGIADFGEMKGAWFVDTEGNIISLTSAR
ncbi:VOC family protein [bacterium]|nr:VOC family protein [bacterium]